MGSESKKFIYSYFQDRLISPETTPFPTPRQSPLKDKYKEAANRPRVEPILEDDFKDTEDAEIELVFETDRICEENEVIDVEYGSTPKCIPDESPEAGIGLRGESVSNVMINVGVDGIDGDANINVIYDLFRLYDNGLIQIWNGVCNDTFGRFKETPEYGAIYDMIYNVKHKEQSRLIKDVNTSEIGNVIPTEDD